MNVGSGMSGGGLAAGVQGLQRSQQAASEAATQIASFASFAGVSGTGGVNPQQATSVANPGLVGAVASSPSQLTGVVEPLLKLDAAQNVFNASAKVVSMSSESIGTLLDITT